MGRRRLSKELERKIKTVDPKVLDNLSKFLEIRDEYKDVQIAH